MKRIYDFLTSMPFMAFLLLALGFAMGIATFIESSYGTPAARSLVYSTHWFELLWGLLALNLVKNLVKYRFFTRRRFALGLFHISFLVILAGAAITRWFSYEGVMHIRENSASDFILSSEDYFYAGIDSQEKESGVRFSEITPKQYKASFDVGGQKIKVKSTGFIQGAERKPVPSESGKPVIDFVFSAPGTQGMQSFNFTPGDVLNYMGFSAGFESKAGTSIHFFIKDNELYMTADTQLEETTMSSQETVFIVPGDTVPVKRMFLYGYGGFRFLIRNFFTSAVFTAVKSQAETHEDAVLIEITDGINRQTLPVFGHSGVMADTVKVPVGESTLKLAYGARTVPLPFSIHLKDFQLEKYPGSESPSSYASEVVLIDENADLRQDHRVFMNNTITYKGYKFFQSSYDTDELGTVLSVNHDFWGTWVTYLGYALLIIGIVLSMVNRNSYFQFLARKLKQTAMVSLPFLVLALNSVNADAQRGIAAGIPDIDDQVVKNFSELWVQGIDGRIEPVSTLSGEIVRKLTHKSSVFGKSPDEMVLGMMAFPEIWRTLPVILVSNKTVAGELGAKGKYITIQQVFDAGGNYLIADKVRAAYAKPAAFRNRVEKEYIYVDERINISFMVFGGALFPVYPRSSVEDKWYIPGSEAREYSGGDSIFIKSGFQLLTQYLAEGKSVEANQVIQATAMFQGKYGGDLIPPLVKKKTEIIYNKINPFKRIFPYYLLTGIMLLFVLFINIFRQKPLHRSLRLVFTTVILLLFLIHTAGLVIRWYISGHAPWSNGYESVVYVAWASMLAGLIFGRKYPMVIGTAAFLTGVALFVAHLSWMNPEVTNLVPVLKSYWLAIHVAIITASYGFIGLSTFLGILVLILIILRKPVNEFKVNRIIEQLTTINEMSATVGLYFLTVGTFLGGVWANESWGRYWGWDPKETWALITVVIYAFIVHMRLIPSLKGVYNYNVASILGFASVLMTYFGVNYYLSGLHSYGKGVADGVNPAVPVTFILLAGLMIWAYIRDAQYEKSKAG